MVSNYRRRYSAQQGKIAHERFVAACEFNKNYKTRRASRKEDIYDHIDVWVMKPNGKEYGVDVKGGNHPNTIWVEFKNVRGNDGWLYGKADYIAFDMPEEGGFSVVPREGLLKYAEENVEKTFVGKDNAYKKLYQRKDRKDVITKLHLSDIKTIKNYSLVKYYGE
jgi:hypothetical protein